MRDILLWILLYIPLAVVAWYVQVFIINIWLFLGNMIYGTITALYLAAIIWIWNKLQRK